MNKYLIDFINPKIKSIHHFLYIFANSDREAAKKFHHLYPKQDWQITQILYIN